MNFTHKRMSETNEKWDIIIRANSPWFAIDWRELWRYRDLIYLFVKRDFIAIYKQTILGPLWYLIQPLLMTFVFTIVFGRFVNIPTDQVPPFLFYLSGLVLWNYFAECLNSTSATFLENQALFGKVYFPRLAVPISVLISKLIKLAIQLALLAGLYLYFYFKDAPIQPSPWLPLVLPLLVLQMALMGFGTGILISSLTTKYRDLNYVVGFGVQLWMYATPIIYPTSQIPEKFRIYAYFNPATQVITNFRYVLFGGVTKNGSLPASMDSLILSIGITTLLVLMGLFFFSRVERNFIDTI